MKQPILYIDDEPENLKGFRFAMKDQYEILLAESTAQAEELLRNNEVKVVVTDQRMPGETGIEFVRRIRSEFPELVFILLTGYSGMDLVVEAINEGGIYRYMSKPMDEEEMRRSINNAIEKYDLKNENEALVRQLKKKNELLLENILQVKQSNRALLNSKIQLQEYAEELKKTADALTQSNTALQVAKNKLEESQAKFKAIAAQSVDGIVLVDAQADFIYTNSAFCRMFGYEKQEIRGLKATAIPVVTPNRKLVFDARVDTEGAVIEMQIQKKDLSCLHAEVIWKKISFNGRHFTLGTVRDVTEKVEANNKLAEARRKAENHFSLLQKITDNYPNSYLSVIEKDMKIGFSGGQEFTKQGLDPRQFYGQSVAAVYGDKANFVMGHYERVFNGESISFEMDFAQQQQLYNAVPITESSGEINRILVVVENISERKKAERELIEAKESAEESDRLKTEFLNNLSHEIRTPMNGIMGFAKLLLSKKLPPEKVQRYGTLINTSGHALLRVIEDILEISRLETLQVQAKHEQVNINEVMFDVYAEFEASAKAKGIPLYTKNQLNERQSWIYSDGARLSRILKNFVSNALKYTHAGFVELGCYKEGDKLNFYVKDTGIGIAEEKKEKIFIRFSQLEKDLTKNAGGLGLGLSIAKGNADLLGGSIYFESEKNQGSSFYLKLPYGRVYAEETESSLGKPTDKLVFLIAEDDEVNYMFLETLIETLVERESIFLHARNGLEAIDLCKQHPEINLVLMDLKMPDMNGLEATTRIKEINPNLAVVAQTAHTTPEDKRRSGEAGIDDFLIKPIDDELFRTILHKYIGSL